MSQSSYRLEDTTKIPFLRFQVPKIPAKIREIRRRYHFSNLLWAVHLILQTPQVASKLRGFAKALGGRRRGAARHCVARKPPGEAHVRCGSAA
eukprot:2015706-Prymnesium_polylepis.1